MKLAPLLSPETIAPDLRAADRRGVLAELSELLVRAGLVPGEADLPAVLEERENLGSTGIGDGVAIPHVRLGGIDSLRIAVGRSAAGVEFGAVDGRPVHLFFLLLAPEEAAGDHLKALARISRVLKNSAARQGLMEAGSAERMMEIIAGEDEKD